MLKKLPWDNEKYKKAKVDNCVTFMDYRLEICELASAYFKTKNINWYYQLVKTFNEYTIKCDNKREYKRLLNIVNKVRYSYDFLFNNVTFDEYIDEFIDKKDINKQYYIYPNKDKKECLS